MRRVIAIALAVLVAGCVATTANNSSYPQPAKAVQGEKWAPIMEGSRINVDLNYKYEMKLSNGRLLRQENWNDALKPFISNYSQEKADTIIDGLTRYYWEYDKVDKKVIYHRQSRWLERI